MDDKTLERLAKEKRTAYVKEWRKKNREKVKAHNESYWKKRVLRELQKKGENRDN